MTAVDSQTLSKSLPSVAWGCGIIQCTQAGSVPLQVPSPPPRRSLLSIRLPPSHHSQTTFSDCSLLPAAITNEPVLSGFRQHEFIVSQSWRPEVRPQCVGRVWRFLETLGENSVLCLSPRLGWWLVTLEFPGCEEASPQCLRSITRCSLCPVCLSES